jgi:hypothetical protein
MPFSSIIYTSGVQEFRSSGVQEFRSPGVQEFRSSGVQEFRSSGVQEFRSSGVQEFSPFVTTCPMSSLPVSIQIPEFVRLRILQLLNSCNS